MARNALKNLRQLNKAHEKFMKLSLDDIGLALEQSGFRLFQSLQTLTPRDTGKAISGWIPVVDQPPSEFKPQNGLSYYSKRPFDITGKVKPDSIIWISNNVAYIQRLDEGHSSQAPNGFSGEAFRLTRIYIEAKVKILSRKKYNV